MTHLAYPFTQEEAEQAFREWGCNCGPTALAFAARVSLETARLAIPEFDAKRYTSPSMMRAALFFLGQNFDAVGLAPWTGQADSEPMFTGRPALVRVQWTGPWCRPGMNPKWAYGQTHWIVAWSERGDRWVFDCNGGITTYEDWAKQIVPLITRGVKRADGGWYPTHVWRMAPRGTA